MLSRTFTLASLLAASGLVAGQLHSPCNPVKGDKCPADKAFGGEYFLDFTKSSYDDLKAEWNVGSLTPSQVTFDRANGAGFTIFGSSGAPTLISNKYIFFGKVEVVVQAAPGSGIITCVVLGSDCEDEIDWEWIGSHNSNVETNYYAKPGINPKFNTYNGNVSVANPTGTFHTYTIDWTPDTMVYSIDGAEVKRAFARDSNGGKDWPQTPMQIRLGSWVAGAPGGEPGTIAWAGGLVDPSKAPFVAWFRSVRIVDYGNGVAGATEYSYKDSSGFKEGIQIVGGSAADIPGTAPLPPPAPAPAPAPAPPSPPPSASEEPVTKDTGNAPPPVKSTSTPPPPPTTTPTPSASTPLGSLTQSLTTSAPHTTSFTTTGKPSTTSTAAPTTTTASLAAGSRTEISLALVVALGFGTFWM